jgi:hypothetical protein
MALPATDTFTTGSDQALTTYSASWSYSSGTFNVVAATDDAVGSTNDTELGAWWNADTFSANHYSQIVVSAIALGDNVGAACRMTASGNYYGFYGSTNFRESFEMNGGVFTTKFSDATAFSVSQVVRIEATSTTITLKINGATVGGLGFTDATHTGGSAGITAYNTGANSGCRLDTFEGGDLAVVTFFGSASNPADNANPATQNNGVYVVTPPASMQTGDLCVMITQCLSTAAPFTTHVPLPPNQSWTSETIQAGTTISTQLHWCTFNGTWSSDPAGYLKPQGRGGMLSGCGQSLGDTTIPFSVILLVFRPTTTSKTWAIDVAKASATYAAPTTPFTVTRTGITTVANNVVAIAVWSSADDNTWTTLAGAGWVQVGSQWRNLAGGDMSTAAAYQIVATGGTATGSVSLNQATLGGDAGNTTIIGLKEV